MKGYLIQCPHTSCFGDGQSVDILLSFEAPLILALCEFNSTPHNSEVLGEKGAGGGKLTKMHLSAAELDYYQRVIAQECAKLTKTDV